MVSWDAQIYLAKLIIIGNSCFSIHHQVKAHSSVYINWILTIAIKFFSNNLCPCVYNGVNGVK